MIKGKKIKNIISVAVIALIAISLNGMPVHADNVKEVVPIVQDGGRGYVSMKEITQKMGGSIELADGQSKYYSTFTIGDKSIKIYDGYACAFINDTPAPYETKEVNGYTVPAWVVPKYTEEDVMVPIAFVEKNLGVKTEGDKATFEVAKKEDGGNNSTATNGGTNNNAVNSGAGQTVANNKPASNTNSGGSTSSGSGSTTKPSGGGSSNTGSGSSGGGSTAPTTPKEPAKPPVQQQKIYTGSQVKQKLYGLGFKQSKSGSMIYSTNENLDLDAYKYATFYVLSGDLDMRLVIYNSDTAFDQKLRTLFGYILPSSGGKLYSILDNSGVQSQRLTLDGRRIGIDVNSGSIVVDFGPIIK